MKALSEIKASLFDALAHPLRLKILEKLRAGPCCVCKLIPCVGAEQSNVSHHLAILKKAGIVSCEKRGSQVWYYAVDRRIFDVIDLVGECIVKHLRENDDILQALIKDRR